MAGWSVVANPDTSAWKPITQTPTSTPAPQKGLFDRYNKATEPLTRIEPHVMPHSAGDVGREALKGVGNIGAGALGVVLHPIDTAVGIGKSAVMSSPPAMLYQDVRHAINPAYQTDAMQAASSFKSHPLESVEIGIGQAGALGAAGEVGGAIPKIGGAVRSAAVGDTDAAALRGLRVPPGGKKVLPMQSSVQNSRPYLQGAKSLEDLQSRIPAAKSEIFSPYKETLDAAGDTPVKGPDGMTTIRSLEDERQELSAMNRGLKTGDPSALRLAEQKGMSQADSLAREKAIQSHLDPALSRYGIDPQGIRQAYGSVSRIGNQVEGRSTLMEKPQPSGLGKIGNISIKQPFKAPGQIISGMRDIAAGRPLFRMSPTDVGIREGFADAGPKPDFGRYTPFQAKGELGAPPINLGGPPETGGTPEGFRPPPFYHDTDAMRTGRLLKAPPIQLGGAVEPRPTPAYAHDTTPQRLGRLLPEPQPEPIRLGGTVEGTRPPSFRHDTTPMRQGKILPPPTEDLPLSSHSDIFTDQRPGSTRVRGKIIEGKK